MPAIDLPLQGPYDLALTLRSLVRGHGDRTIRVSTQESWWTGRMPSGPTTLVVTRGPATIHVAAHGPGAAEGLARAPDLLGLGPASRGTAGLRDVADPRVARLANRAPGIRVPRTGAVFEALVAAILEQKVTGTEARHVWHGLVRAFGEPAPGGEALGLRLFPAPAALAALPYHRYHPFGLERRRADLVRAVANRAAWFEAIVDLPLPDAYARLLAVPGIGPWTAAEVAVRALGDEDAVSVGDFHIPNLVSWALAGEPRGSDARMLELLEPYRGRRALVVRLLELSGMRAPRYGPRLAPRMIAGI